MDRAAWQATDHGVSKDRTWWLTAEQQYFQIFKIDRALLESSMAVFTDINMHTE